MPQPNRVADAIRNHLRRADGSDPYSDMTDDELTTRWNAKNPPNAPVASSDEHPALHAFERSVGEDKSGMDLLGGLVGGFAGPAGAGVGVAAADALANLAGKAGGDNQDQSAMDLLEEAALKGGMTAVGGKALGYAGDVLKAAPPIADLTAPTSKAGLIKTLAMGGARMGGNALRWLEDKAGTAIPNPFAAKPEPLELPSMDSITGRAKWSGAREIPYRAGSGVSSDAPLDIQPVPPRPSPMTAPASDFERTVEEAQRSPMPASLTALDNTQPTTVPNAAPSTPSQSPAPLPSQEGTVPATQDQSYTDFAQQMDDIINATTADDLAREAGSGPQRRITKKGYPSYTNTYDVAP